MYYYHKDAQTALNENLADWCKGGPRPEGWTRSGFPVCFRPLVIDSYQFEEMLVDDVLSKNRIETQRWHIQFLQAYVSFGKSKFYWKKTLYYWEYIKPRFDDEIGFERAKQFMSLFEDILDHGVRRAIWVADVGAMNLPFKYFRFDGCHRACCAKVCGMDTVPAILFKVKPMTGS